LATRILNLGLLPVRFPLIGLEFRILSTPPQFFVNFISNWNSFARGGKLQSNRNAISRRTSLYPPLSVPEHAQNQMGRTHSSCLVSSWHRTPVNIYINSLRYKHASKPPIRGLATAVRSVMDTGLQLTRVHTLYTKALRKIMEWVMGKKYHYLIGVS